MARRSSKITQGLWPQWPAAVLVRTEDLQKLTYEFLYSFRLYVYVYIYIYIICIYCDISYIYIYCKWGLYGDTVSILPVVFQGIDRQTQCLAQVPQHKENQSRFRCMPLKRW